MELGFIGLGLMGRPMVGHLAAAGHRLHLWARRPASLEPFRQSPARLHDSPADVARAAEVVFTMVANGPDVEQVLFGEQGMVSGARRGLGVVDMSTISPAFARDFAQRLESRGIDFIDAPVSGGELGAINASLTIMAGGRPEVFERVLPLLRLMGAKVTLIGDSGAGQVAKACNQILTGVTVLAVAEALNFARASGVDAVRVREALMGGFAYSRILENHGQRMLDRQFQPGFKSWMHRKDLDIVLAEAERLGLDSPAAVAAASEFRHMVEAGMGEEDSVAVLKLLEQGAVSAE
jgi:3-hydroxyisobutyrate dehydrogenase-like beta-hydroxyacid dehydrogenase